MVYEAEQASLGRHVALKVLPGHARLDAKLRERFRREARAAAKLHHTNIVPVFGVGEHEGTPYYVMQYIRGQALDEVLGELRRLRRPGAEAEAVGPHPRPAAGGADGAASAAEVAQALLTGRFTAAAATPSDPGRSGGGASATAAAPATTLDGPAPEPAGEPPAPPPPADVAPTPASWPGKADTSTLSGSARDYWRGVARIGIQAAEALALRPRAGHAAPRHQAVEPPARRPGHRLDHRLRPGQGGRRGRPDPHRRHPRHAAVHGPGAVPRRVRPAERRLRAGA